MIVTSPETAGDTSIGVLDDLVGYHMRRASNVFATDFAQAIAGTGMRQVLFGILSIVAANPGINQGNAGRALGIQRANMVSLVNELVDASLIARNVSPEDRRAFALTLTDTGSATMAACLKRIRDHEQRLLADLSRSERDLLIALLARIERKERD